MGFYSEKLDESDALDFRNNLILEYRPINGMRVQGKFGFNTSRSATETFVSPYATDFIGTESTKQGSYNRTEYGRLLMMEVYSSVTAMPSVCIPIILLVGRNCLKTIGG